MPVTVDVSGLSAPLALIMRPWGGVLETAPPGMGENVRATAQNASVSLWRRVVMLPPIERGLAQALSASAVLAAALDKEDAIASEARSDALRALEALIVLLHEARPNARAQGLGLGW
jgi:hypothetical protein